ncbi:MAG TPA: cyclic nucleotide-binding domain-containing protein [Candidatus Sulfotelmatobacter sp.]
MLLLEGNVRAMSKDIQQDLSTLSAAKHGLIYLTANDWALIADKAVRKNFEKGATLVAEGKLTNGVYLIVKGSARAEIPRRVTFPAIGAGEVCGEISFLDELPASASVVALEPVEAYFLDRPTLQALFELFPHLASRFYRSLAANLARRLRHLIGPASVPMLKK